MKVKRSSSPRALALNDMITGIKNKKLAVGFFDTARYADGTPVAYVATIHEYGYSGGGIPPRPFFRPTITQQRVAWRDSLARGAKAVLAGRLSWEAMLGQVGMQAAGQVSQTISKIQAPALAESTVAARAARRKSPGVSKKPLVDTGLMIQSVSSQVQDV